MTTTPIIAAMEAQVSVAPDTRASAEIEDKSWGYIIRPRDGLSLTVLAAQIMAGLLGLGATLAAVTMWLVPGLVLAGDLLVMKALASAGLVGLAALCLWYATRGTTVALEIDTHRGEVREVVRDHTGRSSILSRIGFDAVSDLRLEPGANGQLRLIMACHGRRMPVAAGPGASLSDLRARLGGDLMVIGRRARARHHQAFTPLDRTSLAA